jgi:hypothetical protein
MFNPASFNIAQKAKTIGAAAIVLLATANTFANAADNQSPAALEHHACAISMGLHQPGDLYDTCVRTLDQTLSGSARVRAVSVARSTCAQEGLTPGTPGYAVCVVSAAQSPVDAGDYQAPALIH